MRSKNEDVRRQRIRDVSDRLEALGHARGIYVAVLDHPDVRVARPLTERVWIGLCAKLKPLLVRCRCPDSPLIRQDDITARVHKNRIVLIKTAFRRYLSGRNIVTGDGIHMRGADFARLPEVVTILAAHTCEMHVLCDELHCAVWSSSPDSWDAATVPGLKDAASAYRLRRLQELAEKLEIDLEGSGTLAELKARLDDPSMLFGCGVCGAFGIPAARLLDHECFAERSLAEPGVLKWRQGGSRITRIARNRRQARQDRVLASLAQQRQSRVLYHRSRVRSVIVRR